MAYTANITQNITPSAPDPSGAISSIQSQASIAKTIFGAAESGFEMAKKRDLQELYKEGVQTQEDIFKQHQLMVSEQPLALADLESKKKQVSFLEGERQLLQEGGVLEGQEELTKKLQEKSSAFRTELETAAKRYAEVADAGGISRKQMLDRVDGLVRKYGAMYPSSLPEIRQIVAQTTGVPGADLWAEQTFVRQLFTPAEKVAGKTDKSLEEARKYDRDLILKYIPNISAEQTLALQEQGAPEYYSLLKRAQDINAIEIQKNAYSAVLERSKIASDQDLRKFTRTGLLQYANILANSAVAKYRQTNAQQFKVLESLAVGGVQPTPEQQAAITGLVGGYKAAVNRGYDEAAEILRKNIGEFVSPDARRIAFEELKADRQAHLEALESTDPALHVQMAKTLIEASNRSTDEQSKIVQSILSVTKEFGNQDTIRTALAKGQYEADGVTETSYWRTLREESPQLVPWLERLAKAVDRMPVAQVNQVVSTDPVLSATTDAKASPNPTPMTDSGVHGAKTELVAQNAVSLVKYSWNKSRILSNDALEMSEALQTDLAAINSVGTCLSNTCNGYSLTLVDKNKAAFGGWFSKLSEGDKMPIQYAVSQTGTASLESARKGLADINKKYGTNIRLGVSPTTGQIQVVNPPEEWLVPKGEKVPIAANYLPPVLGKYMGGDGVRVVKPEFVGKVRDMADAVSEFNKTYLPRILGAATAWSIVQGVPQPTMSNNIGWALMQDKPIAGFFDMSKITPQQQTPQAQTKQPVKNTSFKSTPEEMDKISILTEEVSKLEKEAQLAKKRLDRAKAANDSEDVAFYEDSIKRTEASAREAKAALELARKGR